MKPIRETNREVLDLTTADPKTGAEPTIDLTAKPGGPRLQQDRRQNKGTESRVGQADVVFLAEVLADREIPMVTAIDLAVDDLTVVIDGVGPSNKKLRSWGRWALRDESEIGRIITPQIVLAARRLFKMIDAGRPLINSRGTYFQTHGRFSADYVRRNLAGLMADSSARIVDDFGDPVDPEELRRAVQYRLEYFVGLPDPEFDACFRFTSEISREYLLQVGRSERLYGERLETTPLTTAINRRKRKACSLQNT